MISFRDTRVLLALMLLASFLAHLILLSQATSPGGSDAAFYLDVASNGFQIDYIWNWLDTEATVPQPSYGYWQPLASLLMMIGGGSVKGALVLTSLAHIGVGVLTFALARRYTRSDVVALSSAAVALGFPPLFEWSLRTDTPIFYALFTLLAVYLLSRGGLWLIGAGVAAGAAWLTRTDGALLILALIAAVSIERRWRDAGFVIAGAAVAVAPMLIANLFTFGALSGPGVSSVMWMRGYEDIHRYSVDLTPGYYRGFGIRNILRSKWDAFTIHGKAIFMLAGPVVSLLIGAWIATHRPKLRAEVLTPILFGLFLFMAYVLVMTAVGFEGAVTRSFVALLPFAIILAFHALYSHANRSFAVAVAVLFAIGMGYTGFYQSRGRIEGNNAYGERIEAIVQVIEEDAALRGIEPVVLTRMPWEVAYASEFPVIQIPVLPEPTFTVAERYGANYIILPALRRYALNAMHESGEIDPRLESVGEAEPWTVYAVDAAKVNR